MISDIFLFSLEAIVSHLIYLSIRCLLAPEAHLLLFLLAPKASLSLFKPVMRCIMVIVHHSNLHGAVICWADPVSCDHAFSISFSSQVGSQPYYLC